MENKRPIGEARIPRIRNDIKALRVISRYLSVNTSPETFRYLALRLKASASHLEIIADELDEITHGDGK